MAINISAQPEGCTTAATDKGAVTNRQAVSRLITTGKSAAAAIAAGVYKDYKDAAKHMVRINSRVYPNPDRVEVYNKKFQRYMAVSNALDTVWEKFEV